MLVYTIKIGKIMTIKFNKCIKSFKRKLKGKLSAEDTCRVYLYRAKDAIDAYNLYGHNGAKLRMDKAIKRYHRIKKVVYGFQ